MKTILVLLHLLLVLSMLVNLLLHLYYSPTQLLILGGAGCDQ